MKKVLLILGALALVPASHSFAQTQSIALRAPSDPQIERLVKELGVSPDQAPRVESILLTQQQEIKTLQEKHAADGSRNLAADLQASKATYDEQLKAVLTTEQFAKLEQLRKEQAPKGRARRKG